MTAGKARGAKGKKGNGKGKNTSKDGDGSNCKDRDNNWNSGQQAPQFQGHCSHCAKSQSAEHGWSSRKPGHMLEFKTRKKKKEKVPSRCKGAMPKTMWCSVAVTTPRGPASTLLVDSAADDHFLHLSFAKKSPPKTSTGLTLRDVPGNTLSHHGTRHVNLTVGTQGQRGNIDFQVA